MCLDISNWPRSRLIIRDHGDLGVQSVSITLLPQANCDKLDLIRKAGSVLIYGNKFVVFAWRVMDDNSIVVAGYKCQTQNT